MLSNQFSLALTQWHPRKIFHVYYIYFNLIYCVWHRIILMSLKRFVLFVGIIYRFSNEGDNLLLELYIYSGDLPFRRLEWFFLLFIPFFTWQSHFLSFFVVYCTYYKDALRSLLAMWLSVCPLYFTIINIGCLSVHLFTFTISYKEDFLSRIFNIFFIMKPIIENFQWSYQYFKASLSSKMQAITYLLCAKKQYSSVIEELYL